MRHLFKSLSLKNFNEQDIIKTFTEDLNKSEVSLTFRWTNKRNAVFYKLHLKQNGKTIDLLNGTSLNDASGTRTFYIGSFDDNLEIEISYGLLALVSIPKLIVLLTQTNPTVGFQASPKDPGTTNKIDSGSRLEETIKFKIQ
jgi:hypothetical protein